jgi:SAM-dependent methyltransferase
MQDQGIGVLIAEKLAAPRTPQANAMQNSPRGSLRRSSTAFATLCAMTEPSSLRDVRRFWTRHPHVYRRGLELPDEASFATIDRKVFEHHAPWAHEAPPLLSKLVPYAELRGRRVLDLGCGTGWATEALAAAGARTCALDLSSAHARWTRSRHALRGQRAHVVEGDGGALPFRSASFDYVLAWGVLMHAPEPARLAAEILRVLAPGGRFGVMLYHAGSLHWRWTIQTLHGWIRLERLRASAAEVARRHTNNPELGGSPVARAYTRDEARDLFERSGARELELHVHDLPRAMGYFPARRLRLAALLPHAAKAALARRFGFHLWVEGRRDA